MQTQNCVLSVYIYEIINVVIGSLPLTLIFRVLCGLKIETCFLLPFLVVIIKTIFNTINLYYGYKHNKIKSENDLTLFSSVMIILLIISAYGLGFTNYGFK